MNTDRIKKRAARISVVSNTVLVFFKLFIGFISGSVSIISEAIHSLGDLFASFLALFSVSRSCKPADKEHPFGHGKYEDFSGLVEGGLIILAAVFICFEAAKRLVHFPQTPYINLSLAISVMGAAVIVNIVISMYLFKIAKVTDSIALHADAEHLRTDVLSSFVVLAGLLIIKYTSFQFLDAILAMVVALIIMHSGYLICKKTLNNLLDGSLPEEEIKIINQILINHTGTDILDCSSVQTRKSGPTRTIILKLAVCQSMTIKEGHDICDKIENEIKSKLNNAEITIHLEPLCRKNLVMS